MNPAFTVSQSAVTPGTVTVTDTSTSITGTIAKRRVYVQDAYGNYLTGNNSVDYDEWALADTSIALDILTQNSAVNTRVDWLTAANAVVQTLNNNYGLSEYGKQFFFYLVQLLGLTPSIYQDSNYSGNLALLWTNIIAGDNAVEYGNDVAGAQNCYDRATEMQNNQSTYF